MAPSRTVAHASAGHYHAVQFYKDDESLVAVVSKFLDEGIRQHQPAVVVATPEHRAAIETTLALSRHDVPRMKRLGDLIFLDARETLETLLADGMPHPQLFKHVCGSMLEEMSRIHPKRTIRAYGEMVNLLWKDGMTAAAIQLEMMWNELVKSHHFKLLCGYSMDNFYQDAAVGEITRQHTHLLAETGEAATIN